MNSEPAGAPAPRPPDVRILAIDDEDANLRLLRALLAREGYEVETTQDPREALARFEAVRPDLVLVDLHMPALDGLTVMRQIRDSPAAEGFLPILMITGDDSSSARQAALAGGATDFVAKPFDGAEVTLRIRNLLETRRLHAEVRAQNVELEEKVRARTRELERALQRAEAAARAKANFLAKMSHELRTPLNPIRGALELLAGSVPETALRLVEMAGRNVDRMVALIDDILLLQGIEQGNVQPEAYPVHLGALVREVAEGVGGKVERGGLELRVEVPDEVPPIRTDPELLADILRRLLENSVRFTPEGSVTLALVADAQTGEARRIEVRDTGIGIDAERLGAIFAPFEQADNSSTRRYEGAGLGLSISRALSELIGYRIDATSTPGEGSVFAVLLDG